MKELKLGGKLNMVALIDDEDFERVSALPWSPNKSKMRNGQLSTWYAQGRKGMMLHRFILGVTDPKIKVDHKDRNGLNNQKVNLRCGTHSQNLANRPKAKLNTSGFKGVYRAPRNRWYAMISFNDKCRTLGTYATREEAAKAYDAAASQQWGEFAYLNFPEKSESLTTEGCYPSTPALNPPLTPDMAGTPSGK